MTIAGQVPKGPAMPPEEPVALDGERGLPSVNGVKRSGRGRFIMIAFFMLIIAGVAAAALLSLRSGSGDAEEKETKTAESSVPQKVFVAPRLPEQQQQQVVPPIEEPQPALPGSMASQTPSGQPEKPAATLDKSMSGLMIEGASSAQAPSSTASDPAAASPVTAARSSGPLDGLLSGTSTPTRKASMLGDRNYILAKGAFINCALQTRLDSTVPGMTACRVTRNVYSDNGRVLLIERGSLVTGEYQSNMKQGMERIYVLWTRVKTPHGVVVDLDSPAADSLGGAGLPGYVNNHFWKRFGGAMLLSIIDDAAQYFSQSRNSGTSQTIQTDNTSDAMTEMAGVALQNTIDIPPTLYKNQGEEVGIYIARDLDFSGVYRVEPK
jgi:type IV secretion system protein VirB10